MTEGEKFSRAMYGVVVAFKNTLTLPTDESLVESLKFSGILTAISLISNLIGAYTFLCWQGCLLCSVLLIVLLWIERRENDALLRVYRNADVLAKEGLRRAKKASASVGLRRDSAGGDSGAKEAGKRSTAAGAGNSKGSPKRHRSGNGRSRNVKSD